MVWCPFGLYSGCALLETGVGPERWNRIGDRGSDRVTQLLPGRYCVTRARWLVEYRWLSQSGYREFPASQIGPNEGRLPGESCSGQLRLDALQMQCGRQRTLQYSLAKWPSRIATTRLFLQGNRS